MSTEARRLSVLVAEVCGSTQLAERLGTAEASRAAERCLHRMERAASVSTHAFMRTVGEQLQVGYDSADAAAHAAIEIQSRVDALPPVSGINLAVRIAFDHGEVEESAGQYFGAPFETAARLVELSKPGQVLTSAATMALLATDTQQRMRLVDSLQVQSGNATVAVSELPWSRSEEASKTRLSPPPAVSRDTRLRLRHGTNELWVDAELPKLRFGRDPHADLITHDNRASRNHGRIERRHDKFILIDESTNGTFIKYMDEPEFMLRHEETILRGKGLVGFGHSTEDSESREELLEFEVIV